MLARATTRRSPVTLKPATQVTPARAQSLPQRKASVQTRSFSHSAPRRAIAQPDYALPRRPESVVWNTKLKELLNNKATKQETVYKLLAEIAEADAADGETLELQYNFIQQNLINAAAAAPAQAAAAPDPFVLPDTKAANEVLQALLDGSAASNALTQKLERAKRLGHWTPAMEARYTANQSPLEVIAEVEKLLIKSKLNGDPETLQLIYKIYIKEGKAEQGIQHVKGLIKVGLVDQVGFDIFQDRVKRDAEKAQKAF